MSRNDYSVLEFNGGDVRRRNPPQQSQYGGQQYSQQQYDFVGDENAVGDAAGGRVGWAGVLIIIMFLFAGATLGLLIWHISHTHHKLHTIEECVAFLKNDFLPALKQCVTDLQACVTQLKDALPGIQQCLDALKVTLDMVKADVVNIKDVLLVQLQACVTTIKDTQLPAALDCLNYIKGVVDAINAGVTQIINVLLVNLQNTADSILSGVNQIKDTDLPAVKTCVEMIKSVLNAFVADQEAIVDDYRCDDGNPCTSDIFQFGGCMHKWKKCAPIIVKDGKNSVATKEVCTPIQCHDICYDDPLIKKGGKTMENPLQSKSLIYNGQCGVGGTCQPNTACKGQCTPVKKRGVYDLNDNRQVGEAAIRNPFLGCPVIPFKIAALPSCICRKEGACLYGARFDMGPEGGETDICHNQMYLMETCNSAFNATTQHETDLLKCLKITPDCQNINGTLILNCQYHFACSNIVGDLNPIVKRSVAQEIPMPTGKKEVAAKQ